MRLSKLRFFIDLDVVLPPLRCGGSSPTTVPGAPRGLQGKVVRSHDSGRLGLYVLAVPGEGKVMVVGTSPPPVIGATLLVTGVQAMFVIAGGIVAAGSAVVEVSRTPAGLAGASEN